MGTDFRDFDNDGIPDIVFAALQRQTFPLFRGLGAKGFTEVTSSTGLRELVMQMAGFGVGFVDFDNDGWKRPLRLTRRRAGPPLAGQRRGTAAQLGVPQSRPETRLAGADRARPGWNAVPPARHRGLAFGDLDGDGRMDAVVRLLAAPAEIWLNRCPAAGHWIAFDLEGAKSNRDGIGAVIRVNASQALHGIT